MTEEFPFTSIYTSSREPNPDDNMDKKCLYETLHIYTIIDVNILTYKYIAWVQDIAWMNLYTLRQQLQRHSQYMTLNTSKHVMYREG